MYEMKVYGTRILTRREGHGRTIKAQAFSGVFIMNHDGGLVRLEASVFSLEIVYTEPPWLSRITSRERSRTSRQLLDVGKSL